MCIAHNVGGFNSDHNYLEGILFPDEYNFSINANVCQTNSI